MIELNADGRPKTIGFVFLGCRDQDRFEQFKEFAQRTRCCFDGHEKVSIAFIGNDNHICWQVPVDDINCLDFLRLVASECDCDYVGDVVCRNPLKLRVDSSEVCVDETWEEEWVDGSA